MTETLIIQHCFGD